MLGERPNGSTNARAPFMATFAVRGPTTFIVLKISGKINEEASRKAC